MTRPVRLRIALAVTFVATLLGGVTSDASPPPAVAFVVHNNTSQTVGSPHLYVNWQQGSSGSMNSTHTGIYGDMGAQTAASASFGVSYEQYWVRSARVTFRVGGRYYDENFPSFASYFWGADLVTSTGGQHFKFTWDSYSLHLWIY